MLLLLEKIEIDERGIFIHYYNPITKPWSAALKPFNGKSLRYFEFKFKRGLVWLK
jgi:hypothetical protein